MDVRRKDVPLHDSVVILLVIIVVDFTWTSEGRLTASIISHVTNYIYYIQCRFAAQRIIKQCREAAHLLLLLYEFFIHIQCRVAAHSPYSCIDSGWENRCSPIHFYQHDNRKRSELIANFTAVQPAFYSICPKVQVTPRSYIALRSYSSQYILMIDLQFVDGISFSTLFDLRSSIFKIPQVFVIQKVLYNIVYNLVYFFRLPVQFFILTSGLD